MCFDETGQLHALAARPLRLYAVPTLKHRGRALSLQQHVPWYTGDWSAASSDKASFAMMALGDGRVAMLIGWFGLLLIADRAGVVTVFNAPPAPPVGTPSIGIAGPMSFIAIARNNSQQFANVQDAALVAAKSPLQLVARPVSVLGVAARHALLWRAGATTVALVQFVREPPLPSWLADVGFAVRSVHWLGNGDPLATVDSALLIGEDGALAVLRVPLAPDAPPFAVLRIIAPLQSLGSLLGAARCTHDGAIVLAFERTFATRMSACWPAENAAFGLSVWVRDDAPVFGAKATAFLHRSNQIVNLAEDGESVRLELTDVVEDRVRVVSCATGRTKPVGNNEHMVAVIAESPVDGEFAVLCESTDNAVIVLQADTDATQRALATWRYVRGAVAQPPSPSQTQTQSADARGSGQGNGEGDSKDAQGQGVGDGQGEGQGDGSGTGAPSEGGGDGERKRAAAELTEEARLFAVRALRDKLAAIDMAEFDARAYEARLSRVATAVTQLRSIFEAAQAASRERQWQTRKTSGELDEHRLVDGLTGERNVYRVRAERDPGLFQPLPKVLIFVVDASASMERFNGYDKRLDRTLDCLVMIMEALDGWEQKYAYEIVGHSGDQPAVELGAPLGRPPRSRADRWRLLRRVATHAANCPSGDASVEALRRAVRRAASVEADERLVLLLSDANLSRHGIEASDLAEAMALPTTRAVATSSARETMAVARAANVRCRCLFVAQWNDAQRVQAALPRGTVHLVERPDDLPVAIAASMAHEMTAKL
jgi:hypothetical protein